MTDELKARVAAIPYWYHRIELPGGVVKPGWAPLMPSAYKVPADFNGLRVLDVGAWDGYWSFTALERGAREVVAIDDFSDHISTAHYVPRPKWETFDLCRSALGYGEDRCRRLEMSVYDISPDNLGVFDVVFFFGTLYHLRHPLLALDKLSAVCRKTIFVESAVIDDFSPYFGFGQGYSGRQMVMEFYPGSELGDNPTNWWAPTTHLLGQLIKAAGFNDVTSWKIAGSQTEAPLCRGFAKGTR